MAKKKIQIYDTTLRDGSQAEGVALTVDDKIKIAKKLDELGVDFIEGGWPGSNPKDSEFFERMKTIPLARAKLVAFGATKKFDAHTDTSQKSFQAILDSGVKYVCLFGKTWDLHVSQALKITPQQNLQIIADSMAFFKKKHIRVFFDAEHFFDGYKANPRYALQCLKAAAENGASLLVLCDTNGGTLPHEVSAIVKIVAQKIKAPLGIHCHNDCELAVANSLAAVDRGAIQVQGTINGIGERCGNVNLISVIGNLSLKMSYQTVPTQNLSKLKDVSHYIDQVMNRNSNKQQAFTGDSAFAHKGGVHVNAVLKNSKTYEHINPQQVGNRQRILLSDLSGLATIQTKLRNLGLSLSQDADFENRLLSLIKQKENEGYEYEDAEASFALMVHRAQKKSRVFFDLVSFHVTDGFSGGAMSGSQATVRLNVKGKDFSTEAQGVGPVHALDLALRKGLETFYPQVKQLVLVDYKVRVLSSGQGTSSLVRVHIEFSDGQKQWSTVGVSENIIQASHQALTDGINYYLLSSL